MKVAIPHYGEEVAPCFESTAAIAIFTIRGQKVVAKTDFSLQSQEAYDRVRLLRDQGVGTLICGGLRASFEDLLRASGIRVLSWLSGTVDELLELFLEGQLPRRRPGDEDEKASATSGPKASDSGSDRAGREPTRGMSRHL